MSPSDERDAALAVALAEPSRQNLLQSVRNFGGKKAKKERGVSVKSSSFETLVEDIVNGSVTSMRDVRKRLGVVHAPKATGSGEMRLSTFSSISASTLQDLGFNTEESEKLLRLSKLLKASKDTSDNDSQEHLRSALAKQDLAEGATAGEWECEMAPVATAEFEGGSESGDSFLATPRAIDAIDASVVDVTPSDAIEVKPMYDVEENDAEEMCGGVSLKGGVEGIEEVPAAKAGSNVAIATELDISFASVQDLQMGVPVDSDPQSPSFDSSKPYVFSHKVFLNAPPNELSCDMLNGRVKRVDQPLALILGDWSNTDPLWNLLKREVMSDDVAVSFLSLPKGYGKSQQDVHQEIEPLERCGDGKGYLYSREYEVVKCALAKKTRLVLLRDPEGEAHWGGDWSQFDKSKWTKRMQKLLDYKLPAKRKEEIVHETCTCCKCFCCCCYRSMCTVREIAYVDVLKEGPDFWISLQDAITCSLALVIKTDIRGWHHLRLQGCWRGMTAGGPPGTNFINNPRYKLGLQWHPLNPLKRSRVLMSMSGSLPDATEDYYNKDDHGVNLMLFSLNGERLTENVSPAIMRGTTGSYSCDKVTMEVELPRIEDLFYTLVPSKQQEGIHGTFVINLFAQVPFMCVEEATGLTHHSQVIKGKSRVDVEPREEVIVEEVVAEEISAEDTDKRSEDFQDAKIITVTEVEAEEEPTEEEVK